MEINVHDKNFLQALGRSSDGKNLVVIMEKMKAEYSSIDSIDTTKDTGAQVEGRKLFCDFIDEFCKAITVQKHSVRPLDRDDYT